jgi:cobalt-zinc-cadmium efflux system outer membrane protein
VAHAEWPTLERVLDLAREHSLVSKEADGQLAVASSYQTWARLPWLANPYLEFQASRGSRTKDLAFTSFLMLPVEINGQRGARIDEANALLRWRTAARDDIRARTEGDAVTFYGLTIASMARIGQYEHAEADAKAETDYYAARLAAGDATLVDKSLADAELGRYAQLRAEATIDYLDNKSRLEQLIGVPLDPGAPPSIDPPALRSSTADAFVRLVLDASPTLKALSHESGYWGAQSNRVARDANVPLNLIVNFSRTEEGDLTFGGGLSWYFPMTQRNQGAVAQADAQRGRADAIHGSFEPLLAARARSLYEQATLARSALAAVDANALPAAERLVDSSQQGYKAGKIEYLHVLQARRDRATAQARRLDLVAMLWRKYGEMVSLLGGLP